MLVICWILASCICFPAPRSFNSHSSNADCSAQWWTSEHCICLITFAFNYSLVGLKNPSSSGSFGNHRKKITSNPRYLVLENIKEEENAECWGPKNVYFALWEETHCDSCGARTAGAPYLTDNPFPFPSKCAGNEVWMTHTRDSIHQRLEAVRAHQWIGDVASPQSFLWWSEPHQRCPLLLGEQ